MKKIIFLGDSITEGCGASNYELSFVGLLEKNTNFEVKNFGVSGTRIAKQTISHNNRVDYDEYFLQRAKKMDDDADCVIVFGGTNDFGHGDASIGKPNSNDDYTFYGALNNLVSYLCQKYGKNKVNFILPIPRYDQDSTRGSDFVTKPIGSCDLHKYKNVMKEVLNKNSISYFDFSQYFDIPKDNGDSEYFKDGLHPNDKGHALLAKLIEQILRSIL